MPWRGAAKIFIGIATAFYVRMAEALSGGLGVCLLPLLVCWVKVI